MPKTLRSLARYSLIAGLLLDCLAGQAAWAAPIKPKVMLITMFAPEAQAWIERLALKREIPLAGLSAEYPNIRCNDQDTCLLVTGMGQTNATASTLALALSPQFDLRQSYFLIAGIAGINPHQGTLGTAAWAHLSERAEVWTRLLTDNNGVYCTTQQEDNSTYEALFRASKAGRVDINRLAVLRAGSDFDRPYPGYSEVDNLLKYADQGGFVPALENLYRAGNPLVQAILGDWKAWEQGVPEH